MKRVGSDDPMIDISVNALLDLKGKRDDVDAVVATDNIVQTKKKKRVRRRYKTVEDFLRPPGGYVHLPNTDVRFTYPSQLVETLNELDITKFNEIIRNICDPNVQIIQDFGGVEDPIGPNRKVICGVEALIDYATLTTTASPDFIMTLDKKVVGTYNKSTNEAHIQYTVLGKCTKVCRIVESTSQPSNAQSAAEIVSDDDGHADGGDDIESVDRITTSFANFNLEPIQTPLQKTVFVTRMALMTNSEGKIHTLYKRITKVG